MYIDHVNTLLSGGAAVAAQRLHRGLLAAGIGSRLWHSPLESAAEPAPGLFPTPWPLPDASSGARAIRIAQQLKDRIKLSCVRSYFRRGHRRKSGGFLGFRQAIRTPYEPKIFDGDIVHFHWVGKSIDFPSFFRTMPMDKPLVWSLHDMHPMTGGCSHAYNCVGFTRSCGDCPVLGKPSPHDLSYIELQLKHEALRGRPVSVIAPSHWMASMAKSSSLFRDCSIEVIRNPIDTNAFFPQDKSWARKELGLPEEGICLLYGAESLEVKEKGIREYSAVLSRLSKSHSVFGLAFGRGEIAEQADGVPIHSLGFLASPSKLRLAYSAADIYLMPSHAETISQTTVEAFACRTPAVAFEVGGIPELVRDGETGFLVRHMDVAQMAERVGWLIDHPEDRLHMGQRGLDLVHREFNSNEQILRYIDFYTEILDNRNSALPAGAMQKTSSLN